MSFETITTAREGDVLTITLNRPDRLNACPPDMADEIFAAIRDLDGARAVLITGRPSLLFGRGSRRAGRTIVGGGEGAFTALGRHYNPMVMALASLLVPVVAAVNGPAAGIGYSIALATDFVIAGSSAYFRQAFVNIGLVPDGGASWMLPRLVGKAQATRMMMLGEKIPAEAERIGLIYKGVADDALMDEAKALAAKLAGGPTVALGEMKQTIRRGLEGDFATTLQYEAEAQRVAEQFKDAMEGGMAFLQKRKPEFKGA